MNMLQILQRRSQRRRELHGGASNLPNIPKRTRRKQEIRSGEGSKEFHHNTLNGGRDAHTQSTSTKPVDKYRNRKEISNIGTSRTNPTKNQPRRKRTTKSVGNHFNNEEKSKNTATNVEQRRKQSMEKKITFENIYRGNLEREKRQEMSRKMREIWSRNNGQKLVPNSQDGFRENSSNGMRDAREAEDIPMDTAIGEVRIGNSTLTTEVFLFHLPNGWKKIVFRKTTKESGEDRNVKDDQTWIVCLGIVSYSILVYRLHGD